MSPGPTVRVLKPGVTGADLAAEALRKGGSAPSAAPKPARSTPAKPPKREAAAKARRMITCSRCQKAGHNARGCPDAPTAPAAAARSTTRSPRDGQSSASTVQDVTVRLRVLLSVELA